MILTLKEGQVFELGENTGILLENQIIKIPSIAFGEDSCVISLFYFKDEETFVEGGNAFDRKTIQLGKEELVSIKEKIGDIFLLENNLVFLNPDKVNSLLSVIQMDGSNMGEKYERKTD